MYKSFYNDINFQRKDELTEQNILQHFRHAYESNTWPNFWALKEKGLVPYPYKLRKFKHLSTSTSIISHFHHVLCSSHWFHAMFIKAVDFFLHTNLFNPTQALPIMKLLFMQLHNKFSPETVFNLWAADVKEMYDWLPQTDILRAIKWILSYIAKASRRTSVAVYQMSL